MKSFLKYSSWGKPASCHQSCRSLTTSIFRFLIFGVNPFLIHICYFIILSLLGFLALKVSKPRASSATPGDLDVFFTSVSAATVSSMSAVEMEYFSNTQLVILTILMLLGGEVFTSMLGLQFMRFRFKPERSSDNRINSKDIDSPNSPSSISQIELGVSTRPQFGPQSNTILVETETKSLDSKHLEYNSIKYLSYVVMCYLLVVHLGGSTLISLYIVLVPSAREVLNNKRLHIQTFSAFTTVSTFSNCGFIPTNENMMVFKKNSGLLLLLIPQVLLGNTLYAPCLRLVMWALERVTKRKEFTYLLKNSRGSGYSHMLPCLHSCFLAATVFGLLLAGFVLFCSMEWNSQVTNGLTSYQKFVGSLFVVVNSRHSGESVFDLSLLSPAILVLFIVMMYLPPYTSVLPIENQEDEPRNDEKSKKRTEKMKQHYLLFSPLSYLAIAVILLCITEREKIKEDPLNFNLLSITLEVVSGYGNVGFSMGYSCARQLKPDGYCKDAWYGLAGKWSSKGKLILIIVMFFGRLKKFSMNGGRAWKLS